jgi:DNA mismatch endonuclease (patch repair protein)
MDVGKLDSVPLRKVWPHEARDFATWLELNPEVLGEAFGAHTRACRESQDSRAILGRRGAAGRALHRWAPRRRRPDAPAPTRRPGATHPEPGRIPSHLVPEPRKSGRTAAMGVAVAVVGRPVRVLMIRPAPGLSVPYPSPASKAASAMARGNRKRDTRPEVALRAALHRRGLRFRKDYLIEANGIRLVADIVFTRLRVAVFLDGCFWHGCGLHQRVPRRNAEYWIPKLEGNVARDRRVDDALSTAGWTVRRVWEHEDPEIAARALHVELHLTG